MSSLFDKKRTGKMGNPILSYVIGPKNKNFLQR